MNTFARRAAGLTLAALAALALGHCGGNSGAGPSTVPTPPVSTTPTPTPLPTSDPPISASCAKLPPGAANPPCSKQNPDYQEKVDKAIRTLQVEQPWIFDGDQVLSSGAYYVGVIKILDRDGLCADNDGEELGVTDGTGWNEQYHILTSQNRARFGPVSYMSTCTPSAVPIARAPLGPATPGCSLPPSREITCGREPEGKYVDDVNAAIQQIQKDHPEYFDFNDFAPGTSNPAIKNGPGYNQGVINILIKQGYCAHHDGEELGVKRGSNAFNEQYDIDFQGKYVRTGSGIYRSSCYPSAF